ncbi:MAG: LD-carboxypeptidase [Deltaproteobacteria bacterium]|mgnify:CR=1 FL=1|nr:LD-carboxypeptidase [Deltaproteobacteria bacterium]
MSKKNKLLKLGRLVSGDGIGVIAFSSPIESSRLERGLSALRERGFAVKVALQPSAEYGKTTYLFGSDSVSARAKAFGEMLEDPEVKVILAARGAYGSLELLPYLDFSALTANPKAIVGFSDVTCILLAAYERAGVTVIHGPSLDSCVAKIGVSKEAARSFSALLELLEGREINPFRGMTFNRLCGSERGEGPLIGGNLSLLSSLMGTPWEPNFDGHILFWEEVAEKPYRLDRMLVQMKLAGKFDHLQGVVVGYLSRCEHAQGLGPSAVDVIKNVFKDFDFPVLSGVPFGHELLNLPLPIGIHASIAGNSFELVESPVAL